MKRVLSRTELEEILLSTKGNEIGLECIQPKVFYTVLSRIESLNNVKL